MCEPGKYCIAGSAVAIPCSSGSFSNSTSLTSAAECSPTPPGHYSPIGSVVPVPCAVGSAAPTAQQGLCTRCVPGKFQDTEGATACRDCESGTGFFCSEGASAPLPCPAGTRADPSLVLMTRGEECLTCGIGTFCPVGSAAASPW